VSQVAADGSVKVRWQGRFEVADSAPDARLAPTNFHLPPGTNAEFQKLRPAQVAPLALGVLLWGPQGAPINGVGIAPTRPDPLPQVHRWPAHFAPATSQPWAATSMHSPGATPISPAAHS